MMEDPLGCPDAIEPSAKLVDAATVAFNTSRRWRLLLILLIFSNHPERLLQALQVGDYIGQITFAERLFQAIGHDRDSAGRYLFNIRMGNGDLLAG